MPLNESPAEQSAVWYQPSDTPSVPFSPQGGQNHITSWLCRPASETRQGWPQPQSTLAQYWLCIVTYCLRHHDGIELIPWLRSLWCHHWPGKLTTALGLGPRAVVSFPGRWWHHNDLNLGIIPIANFFRFVIFPFPSLSKQTLPIEYHVYIWQVSPQLSCNDTCQIQMWFK